MTRRRGPGSRAGADHPTGRELLDAAVRLVETSGLRSLSVADITSAAGHAKGTFYVHFADRTALLMALHRWFHDTVFEHVLAATAGAQPGPERVRLRLVAFLDACRTLPGVRALLLEARAEPLIAAEVAERNQQAAQSLSTDLSGITRHPLETARLLVAATADIAARESIAGRRSGAARRALMDLVPDRFPDR